MDIRGLNPDWLCRVGQSSIGLGVVVGGGGEILYLHCTGDRTSSYEPVTAVSGVPREGPMKESKLESTPCPS
jgi:hypothetical protein